MGAADPGGREAAVRAGERRGAVMSEAPVMISSAAVPPSHAEIDRDGTVTATRPARELRRRRTLRGDGALSREDGGRPPCRCVARPSLGARRNGVRARRSRVNCGTRSRPARRAPAGQWAVVDGGRRHGERCRRAASSGGTLGASGAVTGGRRRSRRGRRRGDRAISAPSGCYLLPHDRRFSRTLFSRVTYQSWRFRTIGGVALRADVCIAANCVRPARFPRSARHRLGARPRF
ncbi:MAG: hypothetical protein K0R87_878 [Pseudonocardia sp.]|nr:hypothetical protein [Pseudonocardia sp.]